MQFLARFRSDDRAVTTGRMRTAPTPPSPSKGMSAASAAVPETPSQTAFGHPIEVDYWTLLESLRNLLWCSPQSHRCLCCFHFIFIDKLMDVDANILFIKAAFLSGKNQKCCRSPDRRYRPSTSIWHRGRERTTEVVWPRFRFLFPRSLSIVWRCYDGRWRRRRRDSAFSMTLRDVLGHKRGLLHPRSYLAAAGGVFIAPPKSKDGDDDDEKVVRSSPSFFSSSPWWGSSSCSSSLRPRRHLISFETDL